MLPLHASLRTVRSSSASFQMAAFSSINLLLKQLRYSRYEIGRLASCDKHEPGNEVYTPGIAVPLWLRKLTYSAHGVMGHIGGLGPFFARATQKMPSTVL